MVPFGGDMRCSFLSEEPTVPFKGKKVVFNTNKLFA